MSRNREQLCYYGKRKNKVPGDSASCDTVLCAGLWEGLSFPIRSPEFCLILTDFSLLQPLHLMEKVLSSFLKYHVPETYNKIMKGSHFSVISQNGQGFSYYTGALLILQMYTQCFIGQDTTTTEIDIHGLGREELG